MHPVIPFRVATGLMAGKCLGLGAVAIPGLRELDDPSMAFKTMYRRSSGVCNALSVTSIGFGLYYYNMTRDPFVLTATGLVGACLPLAYVLLPDSRKYTAIGNGTTPGARLDVRQDIESWATVEVLCGALTAGAFVISCLFLPLSQAAQ